jgi:cytochrome c oxidase assembly protein subunit 15
MCHSRLLRAVAIAAFSLCLGVVVLGAYVRLSSAGLGCPDWPGCYGHLTPIGAAADAHTASAPLAGRPLDIGKAWREMVHRYAAGTLGALIVCLTAMSTLWRRERIVSPRFVIGLLAIVLVQGMLGMLTVTWQLKPIIVSLHLLCGFTTLALLWWLVLSMGRERGGTRALGGARERGGAWMGAAALHDRAPAAARRLALVGLIAVSLQIGLGGWTSSNYAAIACPDLPTCQGRWWPPSDFRAAFVLWRGALADAAIDYEGGVLDNPARVAIQLSHRAGAVAVSLALLAAAFAALRAGGRRPAAAAGIVLLLLALQLSVGMSMVLRGFPLWLATAHNACAALLLLATLALNRSLRPSAAPAALAG